MLKRHYYVCFIIRDYDWIIILYALCTRKTVSTCPTHTVPIWKLCMVLNTVSPQISLGACVQWQDGPQHPGYEEEHLKVQVQTCDDEEQPVVSAGISAEEQRRTTCFQLCNKSRKIAKSRGVGWGKTSAEPTPLSDQWGPQVRSPSQYFLLLSTHCFLSSGSLMLYFYR